MTLCPEWTLAWVTEGSPDMEIVACELDEGHPEKHHAEVTGKTFDWREGTSEVPGE